MSNYTDNPFLQGMQSGAAMGTGIQNAINGGTPLQLAMKRVSEGGEDPQAIFQELLQKDPQAAQQFAQYMQQLNTNFGASGTQAQGGGMGGLFGNNGLFGGN